MTITLAQFVTRNTGKWLDFDGAFGAQCVDLVEFYLRDVLGDPPLCGNAIDEFGEDSHHWLWVRNNPAAGSAGRAAHPSQIPHRGDVIIWGPDARIGTGVLGHTAVVLAADANGFTSFDQNWPLRAPCHPVSHSYFGIKGWGVPRALLAPKPIAPPPSVPPAIPPAQEPPLQNPPVNPTPMQPPAPLPPIEPPAVITIPDVPEPPVIAEQGVTTSE